MNVGKIYKTVGIVDEVLGIFSISHPYIILYPLLDDCRLEAAFVACCRRVFFVMCAMFSGGIIFVLKLMLPQAIDLIQIQQILAASH
jgi:hypothetical protein